MGYILSSPLAKSICSLTPLKYTFQTVLVSDPRVEEMPHRTSMHWDSIWGPFTFNLSNTTNYLARNEVPSAMRHLVSLEFFLFCLPFLLSEFSCWEPMLIPLTHGFLYFVTRELTETSLHYRIYSTLCYPNVFYCLN